MPTIHHTDMDASAKILKTSKRKLLEKLRDNYIFHRTGDLKNTPHTKYIDKGYFSTAMGTFKENGKDHFYTKALVTPTGLSFLREFLDAMETDEPVAPAERSRLPREQTDSRERTQILSVVRNLTPENIGGLQQRR